MEKVAKFKKLFFISICLGTLFLVQYLYILKAIDSTNPDIAAYSYVTGRFIESKDGVVFPAKGRDVFIEVDPNVRQDLPMSDIIISKLDQYFENENYSFEDIFQIKLKPWYQRNNGNRYIDEKSEYLFVLKEMDGKFSAESIYKTGFLFNDPGYCGNSMRGDLSDLDFKCFQPGFYADLAINQLTFGKDEYFIQYCILLIDCDKEDRLDFTKAYIFNSVVHYLLIIFSYLCVTAIYKIRKIKPVAVGSYTLQIILTIILWRMLVLLQSLFEYNIWFIFRTIIHELFF